MLATKLSPKETQTKYNRSKKGLRLVSFPNGLKKVANTNAPSLPFRKESRDYYAVTEYSDISSLSQEYKLDDYPYSNTPIHAMDDEWFIAQVLAGSVEVWND